MGFGNQLPSIGSIGLFDDCNRAMEWTYKNSAEYMSQYTNSLNSSLLSWFENDISWFRTFESWYEIK